MAIKISALPNAITINDTDMVPVVQNGVTKKVTVDKLKASSSGATDVNIGNLTDGKGALNGEEYVLALQGAGNVKLKVKDLVKIAPDVFEVENPNPDDLIQIYQGEGKDSKFIPISKVQGSTNVTDTYLEVTGDNGKKYRVAVKNGEVIAYPIEVDTAPPAVATDNVIPTDFLGLRINKIYGGSLGAAPCSHNFVELYNLGTNASNSKTINLNGLYLFYKVLNGAWKSIPLKGIVPPRHSFLIRGKKITDKFTTSTCRLEINDYDLDVPDFEVSTKGITLLLYIGSETPDESKLVRSLAAQPDAVPPVPAWNNGRYVDMFAVGGVGKNDQGEYIENPPHAEIRYRNYLDQNTGAMREDFYNSSSINIGTNKSIKGNNESDIIPIKYNTCIIDYYRPRTLSEGIWGVEVDKPVMKANCPNMINICYGQDGNTARTFTWQSTPSEFGYLKYRKEGETQYIVVETTKEIITNVDGEAMIHRAIIHDLSTGIYEYICGEEGAWSDVSTFEVKDHKTNPIRILHTTDEQSWTRSEYKACGTAAKYIQENEVFDFHLNTGDISQNANRSFEWRDYFSYWYTNRNVCHMTSCGNNDLIDKKSSAAYRNYTTYENQRWNSVYGWDLGNVHFTSLGYFGDILYQGIAEEGLTSTDFIDKQCEWLDMHLTEVDNRTVKPKWLVVYMHLSPFTVIRTKALQPFIEIFEKHKVDLVLCGHHHAYSRTPALYTGYEYSKNPAYSTYTTKSWDDKTVTGMSIIEDLKGDGVTPIDRTENLAFGTTYIMSQATGYKLSSNKEKPISFTGNEEGFHVKHTNGEGNPWWYATGSGRGRNPQQPCYLILEITDETIKVDCYQINGILTVDGNANVQVNDYIKEGEGAQEATLIDTVTINHSDRNTGR